MSTEGRVEHQKLNQLAALLPPGEIFGTQFDSQCRQKSNRPNAENGIDHNLLKYEIFICAPYEFCLCRHLARYLAFSDFGESR